MEFEFETGSCYGGKYVFICAGLHAVASESPLFLQVTGYLCCFILCCVCACARVALLSGDSCAHGFLSLVE